MAQVMDSGRVVPGTRDSLSVRRLYQLFRPANVQESPLYMPYCLWIWYKKGHSNNCMRIEVTYEKSRDQPLKYRAFLAGYHYGTKPE